MPALNQFDYVGAYGANPWTAPTAQLSSLVGRMLGQYGRGSSAGASYGSWGVKPTGPDDPQAADYMQHTLGGQRSLLDEYVKSAAGAGIKRSGMNVRGGPAYDSALHHTAMSNLAAGYGDRFKDAMSYARQVNAEAYRQYADRMKAAENLLTQQQRYLASQSDWDARMGSLQHGDWRAQLDWERDAPLRQNKLEQARMQLEKDRWAYAAEIEDRRRSAFQAADQQRRWQDALAYYRTKPTGRNVQQDWQLDRVMTGLGAWQPLQRSYSVSEKY
jgi:hypothetical protein